MAASDIAGSWRGRHGLWARLARRRQPGGRPAGLLRSQPLADLGMRTRPPGLLRGIVQVARTELRELRSQPGLYIFVPIILLQTIGSNSLAVGAFQTPLLMTSGTLAVGSMNTLTLLVCLLLLFYTVESLLREQHSRLGSIHYATPVRSAAILFGKCLANSLVAVVIMIAAFLGCVVVLFIQGQVPIQIGPFLLV